MIEIDLNRIVFEIFFKSQHIVLVTRNLARLKTINIQEFLMRMQITDESFSITFNLHQVMV